MTIENTKESHAAKNETPNNAATQKHTHPTRSNVEGPRVEVSKPNQIINDKTKLLKVPIVKPKEKNVATNDAMYAKHEAT